MKSNLNNTSVRSPRNSSSRRDRSHAKELTAKNLDRLLFVVSLATIGVVGVCAGILIRGSKAGHASFPAAIISKPVATIAASVAPPGAPADPMTCQWTDDPVDLRNPQAPVTIQRFRLKYASLYLVSGGIVGTRRALARHGVSDFVKDAGATAGLNGTFFANASMNSPDNLLIGPSLCGDETQLVIGPFDKRPALIGRPMVLMSPTRTVIRPYDPMNMDNDTQMREEMPEVSDAFLGGVWLVHNGAAADDDRIATYHVKDANDCRRRAFFAVMPDGRPAVGATDCSLTSSQLARSLASIKIREAVLLDSGFSTSLVFGNEVLVSGHSTKSIPSRPVPHAILLFGNAATAQSPASTKDSVKSTIFGVKS